jgi:hypothetical protein
MRCEHRPFQSEDLTRVNPKQGVYGDAGMIRGRVEILARNPDAYIRTIFVDGKPAAVVGLHQPWFGVGEFWSVMSEDVRKAPLEFHRLIERLIAAHEKVLQLHRTQMTVRLKYDDGKRWAELLGFRAEGVLIHYGPDKESHVMFARYPNHG